jgi:hypothetical protein
VPRTDELEILNLPKSLRSLPIVQFIRELLTPDTVVDAEKRIDGEAAAVDPVSKIVSEAVLIGVEVPIPTVPFAATEKYVEGAALPDDEAMKRRGLCEVMLVLIMESWAVGVVEPIPMFPV